MKRKPAGDAKVHCQLGVTLSRMRGKLPDAIQEIEAAERINPDPRLRELDRLRKAQ